MLSKFCINTLLKRCEVFEPIYFTFCAKGSCSQIDFISTLKCQEIGYTIFVLPFNHNLRCYLVSHVSGNFRLEDKHRDDFSIVDDRAVTWEWDRLLRRRTRRPSHRNLESKLPIKASFLLPNISCCHLFSLRLEMSLYNADNRCNFSLCRFLLISPFQHHLFLVVIICLLCNGHITSPSFLYTG